MPANKFNATSDTTLFADEAHLKEYIASHYPNGHQDCPNMKTLKDYTAALTRIVEIADEIRKREIYKVL